MPEQKFVPVIIGIGDVVNRSLNVRDTREPAKLMLDAIDKAFADTEVKDLQALKAVTDSVDVVACWTWPYDNLPDLLAEQLGVNPRRKYIPESHGGNQPAQLLDDAARRISFGEHRVSIICGGEALASLASCAKIGQLPPPGWTKPSRPMDAVFTPTTRDLEVGLGKPHRIGAPIHIYPLYENAFRAFRGQSIAENHAESAKLYADFAKIAEHHPYAWNYGKPAGSAEAIGTASERNRMICFPYTLLMNAFNTVNLAAACVLTSTEMAQALGIPRDKWIYPLGGAGTRDSNYFWERPNYHTSPSISRSLDAALDISGLREEDIDIYDFYSCFPIVPKLACKHLGLSIETPEKQISLLGGLTSFGGAGNNYSMHAITEMVRQLRQKKVKRGLVLANGGWLTYQHVICLSIEPREIQPLYPNQNPLPEFLETDVPMADAEVEGPAEIETYTVEYNRTNKPVRGFIVGRMRSNGHRFVANHGDASALQQLASETEEPVGRVGYVRGDRDQKGRNLFYFENQNKL